MSELSDLQKKKADLLMMKADIVDRANFKERMGQNTASDEMDYTEVEQRIAEIERRMAEAVPK